MTLNQLRTFLAVAEHESVHGAAQELVVTQAAVSASLAALQKALGVALVAPDGRGLRLTDAGKSYAGYVQRIIGLLDEAGLAAAACADPERGELRIAAVTTAAEQVVPGILGVAAGLGHPHAPEPEPDDERGSLDHRAVARRDDVQVAVGLPGSLRARRLRRPHQERERGRQPQTQVHHRSPSQLSDATLNPCARYLTFGS